MYPQPPFSSTKNNPSAALVQQLYDAQTRQRRLHNEIRTTQQDLLAAQNAVTDAKRALRKVQAAREAAINGLHDSVRTIYKSGAPYGVYTVFATDANYPGRGPYDTQRQLDVYADTRATVDTLSDRLATAVDIRDALIADLASLQRSLRQADALVRRLQSQVTGVFATTPPAAPPAPGAPPTGGVPAAGQLLMPVIGPVTSGYGNRFDPYYRVWQLHAGVDISAPSGTPVRAAAAGRVVTAGYHGGYGNYVCVAHGMVRGQQLTTCYGHLSRILVVEGMTVPAGYAVGAVGSTGASTGPHLHFEVRVGGRPTDPRLWL